MKTILTTLIIQLLIISSSIFSQEKKDINWPEDLEYMRGYLEIIHPALYTYISQEEFNREIDYLKNHSDSLDDAEITVRIVELFAKIQDGHTGVNFTGGYKPGEDYIAGLFHYYPLSLYKFSDGIFVLWATNQYRDIVGRKILKIGPMDIDDAVEQIIRFNNGDNEMGRVQRISLIQEFLQYAGLMEKGSDKLSLTYEKENGGLDSLVIDNPLSVSEFLACFPRKLFPQKDSLVISMNDSCPRPLPLYLSHLDRGGFSGENYWYQYLPDQQTMYLSLSLNVDNPDNPFDAFCERLFNDIDSLRAKKLIIDVRLNGGGNHIELPLLKGIIGRPEIDRKGNLFLITSRRTISASEHLTSQLERYTNVTIFGEPTAARPNMVGSLTHFKLPHSGLKCFCAKNYIQDSDDWDGRLSTKPHVYALLSSDDYRNNLDPVLERIFIYDSIKLGTERLHGAMEKGYLEGGMPGLQDAYRQHKTVCGELGLNFEIYLLDNFSWWIWSNRKEKNDYAAYQKFIADEFPQSTMANYFYARSCQIRDMNDEAVEYYERSLAINPGNIYAGKYLALLKFHESQNSGIKNYGQ